MNIEIPNNISESAAAEIQAIIDRETKAKGEAFVPKYGEKYWVIALHSKDSVDWYEWEADDIDKAHFTFGNYFPTEEAARVAAHAYYAKLDAQYAIARWLAEHQDWLSTDEEKAANLVNKYYVKYDRFHKIREIDSWYYIEPLGVTSFRKRDHAERFIEDCGDHLRVVHGLPTEEE
jgi:hypothetical protein